MFGYVNVRRLSSPKCASHVQPSNYCLPRFWGPREPALSWQLGQPGMPLLRQKHAASRWCFQYHHASAVTTCNNHKNECPEMPWKHWNDTGMPVRNTVPWQNGAQFFSWVTVAVIQSFLPERSSSRACNTCSSWISSGQGASNLPNLCSGTHGRRVRDPSQTHVCFAEHIPNNLHNLHCYIIILEYPLDWYGLIIWPCSVTALTLAEELQWSRVRVLLLQLSLPQAGRLVTCSNRIHTHVRDIEDVRIFGVYKCRCHCQRNAGCLAHSAFHSRDHCPQKPALIAMSYG